MNNPFFKTIIFSVALLSASCTEAKSSPAPLPEKQDPMAQFDNDDQFLDYLQKAHLNYMWDGAEATSGLACERIHLDGVYPQNDQNTVTIGGSGFGVAGLIVGIERGFIPRAEGVARFNKIVDYLTKADRFHGVWPHWLDGPTGKVKPFGKKTMEATWWRAVS